MPPALPRIPVAVIALYCLAGSGPLHAEPLVDLSQSGPVLDDANLDLELRIEGVLPDLSGTNLSLALTARRVDGAWVEAQVMPDGQMHRRATPDLSGVTVRRNRIRGTATVTVPGWRRRDQEQPEQEMRLDLDVRITDRLARTGDGPDIRSERFWVIRPEPQPEERRAEGTAVARIAETDLRGAAEGRVRPPVRPGSWDMGETTAEGGVRFDFDLGRERQNWNFARLSVLELPEVRDLSGFTGIEIEIATDAPRPDVSASVWLREEDGSWYYIKSALPLIDPVNHRRLDFADFVEAEWVAPGSHLDEDYVLDLTTISHVAIGIVDSRGPGEVGFELRTLATFREDRPAPGPARLEVTGRTLSVNGHEVVPAGVFGGYAGELPQVFRPGCQRHLGGPSLRKPEEGRTEMFMIDCWFDRYSTATLLQNVNWREQMAEWGRNYARRARELNYRAQLEFWNEPYLNWARGRGARNYQVQHFDVDAAEEGGPVQVRYRVPRRDEEGNVIRGQFDPVLGPVIPHFAWTREGGEWRVIDTTQFTYWSGLGNGWIYDEMLSVLGPAVKEENPDVDLIAGWGFRWNEDHWASWEMLHKPTIDRNIQWIDGIHEHHYQGDPPSFYGSFEVLTAYGVTAHDKWLWTYNTETGDLVDAPARGIVDTPEKAAQATNYRRMTYNLRDCLYAVWQTPDKLRSRTVIHHDAGDGTRHGWTQVAYGMMANLRGRLIETATDDPDVWVVASIDGTDPRAMPPGFQDGDPLTLVVFVFNDHRTPREIGLTLHAPQGMRFAGQGRTEQNTMDWETFEIGVDRGEVGLDSDTRHAVSLHLPERTAWKIEIPLAGTPVEGPEVVRTQSFSGDIIQPVRRDRPLATVVPVDPDLLGTARRAWLRLVLEDVHEGEGTAMVGGHPVALPKALTADNQTRIVEIPVELAWLSERTPVTFIVNEGNYAGYLVAMTSLVLEKGLAPE